MGVYSERRLFIWLAIAVLIAWKLTVNKAMDIARKPVNANIQPLMGVLYAKPCNHLFIKYHPRGEAITIAMNTILIKSTDNNFTMLNTEAPSTFRIHISLMRCSASKADNPNNPRHAISIAITVKQLTIPDAR